ncbi:hypothetical protein IV203_035579 [Nitzschia inconspicua]|uniref:PDZ domain-containing protein n=1 Tax=Nitzschia inconspicua TaxID=303405 RepID=A0A9K3LEN6_9STRA|nr:hypothetical protein IV203_035579 [Nitzschia inconspicua]
MMSNDRGYQPSMAERKVIFFSSSLGIKLHRDPNDGLVRVVETSPNDGREIRRQGQIFVNDVLCEVQGIANLRNMPLTTKGWGQIVAHLRSAPRPLVLYVVAEHGEMSSNDAVFDPFALGGAGDFNIQHVDSKPQNHPSKRNHQPTVSKATNGSFNSVARNRNRPSRSLTPPKSSFFGKKRNIGRDDSSRNNKSSSGSTTTKSAMQYLSMGTACLIPSELRPQKREDENSDDAPFGDDNPEAVIECKSMQKMPWISNISMDDDFLPLRQEGDDDENSIAQRYGYEDTHSSIRDYNNYQEEHKNDDPRLRGPQPKRPPRYDPTKVPRRMGKSRQMSF